MKIILRITVILAVARAVLLSPADREKGSNLGGPRDEALPNLHVNIEKEIKSCDGFARCTVHRETQVVNTPYCLVADSLTQTQEYDLQACTKTFEYSDKNSYAFDDPDCFIFNIDPKFACNVSEECQSLNFAPGFAATQGGFDSVGSGTEDCPIAFPVSVMKVDPSSLSDYNFNELDDAAITNAAQCMEAALGDPDAVAYMYHQTSGKCFTSDTGVNLNECKTGCSSDVYTSGFIANAKPLPEKVYIFDEHCGGTISLGANETITLYSHASYGCESLKPNENYSDGTCIVNIDTNGQLCWVTSQVALSYGDQCTLESDKLEMKKLEADESFSRFAKQCHNYRSEDAGRDPWLFATVKNPSEDTLGFVLKMNLVQF